jgi:hypothetical protein
MEHQMTSNVQIFEGLTEAEVQDVVFSETQIEGAEVPAPTPTTEATAVVTEHGTEKLFTVEDQAAKTYDSLVPVWDRFAENANKKSLIRVVKAATKWPLQDKVPKFQSKGEFEAFKVLCTILDCKTIMISSVLEERMKKQKEGVVSGENTEEKMA